jgi:hypothetical protein
MPKGQSVATKKAAEYMAKNPAEAPMKIAQKFGIALSTVYRLKTAAKQKEKEE